MFFRFFIWILFLIGGGISGVYLDNIWFINYWNNLFFHLISLIIGVFFLFLVLRISKNTGRFLAKNGREGILPRMQTNVLVQSGIYAQMRHPMHLGLMLFPLAIAFLLGSLSFILIIAPIEIIFILIMIYLIEEPEAIRKFGDNYKDYKKITPAFCLTTNCLKNLIQKPISYKEYP